MAIAVGTVTPAIKPRKRRTDLFPFLLIAPAVLLVGAFTVLSLVFTGVASLTDWDIGRRVTSFIGLGNYVRAFQDSDLIGAFIRSGIFVTSVVALSTFSGFLIAVGLNRKFRGQGFVRALVIVPWVISELATGVFWMILLMPDAPLGAVLGGPLRSATGAMISLICVETWRSVGFAMVMVLASLQSIDESLYEAARVDGASGWRQTWLITFPLVSPTLLVVAILLMIGNFNLVTIIIAFTEGGPIDATTTTALYMYKHSFQYFHIGYGSSIAILMSVVNVIAMGFFILLQRSRGASQ
ncbi:carbohydrate ABC transporter permease [Cucumibacter marinus]|uniref:carbohydrate ABC transporter permease n=1 Tax=Cucumibacter marinus TaxID=1121252 RepID=UPI00042A4440|nr:sugar ABC transporter permease [Cucumibacter marinus]